MKQVLGRGSLGDAYTIGLKLLKEKEDVEILHHTAHKVFYKQIFEIYNMFPNIKNVEFIEFMYPEIREISGIPEENMVWFPEELSIPYSPLNYEKYVTFQTHAGRNAPCPMRREISIDTIYYMIEALDPIPVVLIGTNKIYKSVTDCENLIGETTLTEASAIVTDGNGFCGPEGYMSFLALSFRLPSVIFWVRWQPVEARLLGNPWQEYIIDMIKL